MNNMDFETEERNRCETRGLNMQHGNAFKKGIRVRIKDGWHDSGRRGVALGNNIFCEQWWTPILWDGEEDPDFCKTDGLEKEKC
jgi:hypothetical protein